MSAKYGAFMVQRAFALVAFLFAIFLSACDDDPGSDVDAGTDAASDADADTDADADADSDTDADADGGSDECAVDPSRALADVQYLASDELAGRYPGTEGNEAALAMAEQRFEELGLVPKGDEGTYRQSFELETWRQNGAASLALDGTDLVEGADFAVMGGSGSAEVTAELVFAGYGMTVPAFDADEYPSCPLPATGYDDYAAIDATGKIVVVVRHGPDDDLTISDTCPDDGLCGGEACLENFSYKAANAVAHGAVGMILVQPLGYDPGIEDLSGVSTSPTYDASFASLVADRGVLAAAIPDLETRIGEIDDSLAPQSYATGVSAALSVSAAAETVTTYNILGAIEGTDPEIGSEVVVVGGHIDHLGTSASGEIYAGADDNASGSAVTMEVARVLAGCAEPARTILFALWNGEEEGLYGSIHYVTSPAYPLSSTIAAYSVDMVGAGNGTGLLLYGATDDANAWLMQVMEGAAEDMGVTAQAQGTVGIDTLGYGSDNVPFAYVGIPNLMAETMGNHLYYHTPDDTADTITEADLGAAASLMVAGLKPLLEGTEEQYLTSKAAPRPAAPPLADRRDKHIWMR